MYQIHEDRITTNQGTVVFDSPIYKAIDWGDMIIVELEITRLEQTNNVYAVQNGRILWRVQDQLEYKQLINIPKEWSYHRYVDIERYEKDQRWILTIDFGGYQYLIDPADGKLVDQVGWFR